MNLNAARRLRRCVPGFSIAGWRTWRELNPHPLSLVRERGTSRVTRPLILFRITGRRIKPRADRRPLLTRSQRFRGRTSPDCQRKRLPVELPGTVALTGGCVFRGLLVQNRRVQTVQSGLFGAVSDSGLVVLLRAAACVSLVSSQGFSPPLRRGCGDRKELTYPFSPCFCAKHGQDLTPFAASCRELAP